MNEKVKEILDKKLCYFEVSDATKGEISKQICHQFPKSPDNPDGYEKDGRKEMKEPKGDESRLKLYEGTRKAGKEESYLQQILYRKDAECVKNLQKMALSYSKIIELDKAEIKRLGQALKEEL